MAEPTVQAAPRRDAGVPSVARIRRRRRELHDVWTLELEQEQDDAATGFAPGQFNMLYAMGVGEIPVSHSGDALGGKPVHTIRAVGAVSSALVDLKPGDTLGVRGPYGQGWPLKEAQGRDVVIIAGGIGLAPLRPVLYGLLAERRDYGRVTLLYGARSPSDVLYASELNRWSRRADIGVEIIVDHAAESWDGPVGVVTSLIGPSRCDPSRTLVMICGPEVMMRYSIAALTDMGVPAEAIFLSMERNMKCAIGHCGHCQFGPTFVCKDGPVFRFDRVRTILGLREI